MTISVNWPSGIITVPQADLINLGNGIYELDVNSFRLALKDLEDSEEGSIWPTTHSHNTQVTLSGVTYARTFELLSPYTVTFQDTGSPYTVKCTGANHNISDRKNVNNVSLIIGNSAGLISVDSGGGGGLTAAQVWQHIVENGLAAQEILRIVLAALAGKTSGIGTSTETYKGQLEEERIVVEFDGNNNRIDVTLNGD